MWLFGLAGLIVLVFLFLVVWGIDGRVRAVSRRHQLTRLQAENEALRAALAGQRVEGRVGDVEPRAASRIEAPQGS